MNRTPVEKHSLFNINGFPVLAFCTILAGVVIYSAGGGIGGAFFAMVIVFALVGWFGPKWVVVTLVIMAWILLVELVKGIFRSFGEVMRDG